MSTCRSTTSHRQTVCKKQNTKQWKHHCAHTDKWRRTHRARPTIERIDHCRAHVQHHAHLRCRVYCLFAASTVDEIKRHSANPLRVRCALSVGYIPRCLSKMPSFTLTRASSARFKRRCRDTKGRRWCYTRKETQRQRRHTVSTVHRPRVVPKKSGRVGSKGISYRPQFIITTTGDIPFSK